MTKMKEAYQEKAVPALMKRFNYRNKMEVPKLEKIVVNMGLGEAIQNIKILDSAVQELSQIGIKFSLALEKLPKQPDQFGPRRTLR